MREIKMRRIMSSILSLLSMLLAVFIMTPGAQAAWLPSAPTVLITGANRGIGLELAKQYAARGWNVIATSRHGSDDAAAAELRGVDARHGYVAIEQLDVTDTASIRAIALKYRDRPIDVLINNAAQLDPKDGGMTPLEQLDFDAARVAFDVNSLGPMRVTQAFLPNVERSTQKKVVNITTLAGSFTPDPSDKSDGALPPTGLTYAASKAALNMYSSQLAKRLKPKGIVIALVTPTLVATKPGMEGFAAPVDSEVAKLIKLIDRMTAAQSGVIVNFSTGKTVPF